VITISIDKKNIKDQLIFLSKNNGSDLTSFFDKKKELYKALKLRGIPTTILIDKNGFIVSKHEGILKWAEDKVVKKIVNLID
jgi:thioredoxin-related protein